MPIDTPKKRKRVAGIATPTGTIDAGARALVAGVYEVGEGGSDWGSRHGEPHATSGLVMNTPIVNTFSLNQFSGIIGFIVLLFL